MYNDRSADLSGDYCLIGKTYIQCGYHMARTKDSYVYIAVLCSPFYRGNEISYMDLNFPEFLPSTHCVVHPSKQIFFSLPQWWIVPWSDLKLILNFSYMLFYYGLWVPRIMGTGQGCLLTDHFSNHCQVCQICASTSSFWLRKTTAAPGWRDDVT